MNLYHKFQDVKALDSLGVWYKCKVVEVKDGDYYLLLRFRKRKHSPSAESQVLNLFNYFQNLAGILLSSDSMELGK